MEEVNVNLLGGSMMVTGEVEPQVIIKAVVDAGYGASLPVKFEKIIRKYEDNKEALFDAGLAYAINQIVDLIASGVDGIHVYTMNNPKVAGRICDGIKNLI